MIRPAVASAPAARIARTKNRPGRGLNPGCAAGRATGNVTGERHRVVLLSLGIETIEGGRATAVLLLGRLRAVQPGADQVLPAPRSIDNSGWEPFMADTAHEPHAPGPGADRELLLTASPQFPCVRRSTGADRRAWPVPG